MAKPLYASAICFLLINLLGCNYANKHARVNPCWSNITFFAMDTATKDASHRTAESQVVMLKELGYAGIGYWQGSGGLPEVLKQLDIYGLDAFPVYMNISLDTNEPRCPDNIKETIRLLKGRRFATIWLNVESKSCSKSSPQCDSQAVAILREIADTARPSGVQIALYPHYDTWLERVEDAVRIAKKVDRPNLGITFNLCHWLRSDDQANLRPILQKAMPHLFVVTINGADSGGTNWKELIQPLDQGTFDTYILLKELKDLGYRGPFGLQGYGIGGDVHENLRRSMAAWKKLVARLDEDCEKITPR